MNPPSYDVSQVNVIERDFVLTSICLYPNDEYLRKEYIFKSLYYLGSFAEKNELPENIANSVNEKLTIIQNKLLSKTCIYNMLVKNTNMNKFLENTRKRFIAFSVAGDILDTAIKENIGIRAAASLYCEELDTGSPYLNLLSSCMKDKLNRNEDDIAGNIWKKFKNVAHIAAAMRTFPPMKYDSILFKKGAGDFDSFAPFIFNFKTVCTLTTLPRNFDGFLSLAEAYRKKGVKFKMPTSSIPLMDEASAWIIKPAPFLVNIIPTNIPIKREFELLMEKILYNS